MLNENLNTSLNSRLFFLWTVFIQTKLFLNKGNLLLGFAPHQTSSTNQLIMFRFNLYMAKEEVRGYGMQIPAKEEGFVHRLHNSEDKNSGSIFSLHTQLKLI